MPVPSSITDLSTTPASNSPSGSENPIEGDNHLRTAYAFIRQLYDGATGAAYATLADLANTSSASLGDALMGVKRTETGAIATTQHETNERRIIFAREFGMDPANTAVANAAALLVCIQALRANAVTLSTDGLGSGPLVAYSSGVIDLGPGHFKIAPDTLSLTQDLGLIIRGRGSRRTNNAVRGTTCLLVSGTSSGYGVQVKGNGARGLTLEDLDLCYETSAFTGHLFDVYSAPGVTLNRVFIGTYGITAGTRLQTAASCIRATYDEFLHAIDCVFDGAVDGFYSDDTREPSAGFSDFGGSQAMFTNCTFYDFTGDTLRHDGNRTRTGLGIDGCTFNPIAVDCVRSVNLNNVEGLSIRSAFSPSTTFKASTEWMRLVNCTGVVNGCLFDDLTKAGTIDGQLEIVGNRIASTDGFTLMGGVITAHSNEFSAGTAGWKVTTPSYQLTLKLGPDVFKAAVTNSYVLGASQVTAQGKVDYDSDQDASSGKFTNSNPRIGVVNIDERTTSQSANFTTDRTMSGRTHELTKTGSTQAVTLHSPTGGREVHRFFKTTSQQVTITCAGGTNFYTGETSATTVATCASTAVGAYLEVENYGSAGWKVVARSAGWTFT